MPLDIATLIARALADGSVERVAANARAQFGTARRRYLGAELLPERRVNENSYREDQIRYRTVIANDGTRYSPTQKKGADLIGSFLVELGEMDIAAEMTGREYDALLRLLASNASMDAMVTVLRWLDTRVNLALIENLERQRWEALVDAQVTRRGDNEYAETVSYSNPANHRVAAGGQWSNDAYDPFDDMFAQAQLLADKGFEVGRMVTSRKVVSILAGNDKVKSRVGVAVVNPSGQIQAASGRATLDAINGILQADGLPPFELYDLKYRTSTGTVRFMKDDVVVMTAATERDEEVDLGDDNIEMLDSTLGYAAIGRAAGQSGPGRVIRMEHKQDKPPRIEAEGWATALPVITEPEAISVISGIS